MQRLRRVSLLLFFFSQVLYLSSEPQGLSIQVQACRSGYWWYRARSGISTLLAPRKKARPHQEKFCTNIPESRGDMYGFLPRGPGAAEFEQSRVAFVFSFHKEYRHILRHCFTKQALLHLFVASLWFFFLSLILLFKWLNKEVGCSCYKICEKHSVSRISEQLRCWVFQTTNTELNLELEDHPERSSEPSPASEPSRIWTWKKTLQRVRICNSSSHRWPISGSSNFRGRKLSLMSDSLLNLLLAFSL